MSAYLQSAASAVSSVAQNRKVQIALGAAVLLKLGMSWKKAAAKKAFFATFKEQKPGVVYLYLPGRFVRGCPNWSQWSAKVEAFLRVNKIPYVANHGLMYASFSPLGTVPFVVYNGVLIADSEQILEDLSAKVLGKTLDSHLDEDAKYRATALRRLVELSMCPHVARTTLVDNIGVMKALGKDVAHPILLGIMMKNYRKTTIARLNASGLGDLPDAKYQEELVKDFKTVEQALASKKYLFSETTPSALDCTLYACLSKWIATVNEAKANNIGELKNSKGLDYLMQSEALVAYTKNFEAEYYPDLNSLCEEWKTVKVKEFNF